MKLTIYEDIEIYNKTKFISSVINNIKRMRGMKKPVRDYFSAKVVSDKSNDFENWRYEVYINPEEPRDRQIMTKFLVMDKNSNGKFVDYNWVNWTAVSHTKQWTQLIKEFLLREVGKSFDE